MELLLRTTSLIDREVGALIGCSDKAVGNYRRRWGIPVASERVREERITG